MTDDDVRPAIDELPYPKDKFGRYLVHEDWEPPSGFRGKILQRNMGVFISANFSGKKEAPRVIYVRGAGSAIAQALNDLHQICPVPRGEQMPAGEKYLFCAGLIHQKRVEQQTDAEIWDTWNVNCMSVIRACDRLIESNPKARICVVGSESAFKGSFDAAYAAAKSGLHRYVETKRLKHPGQQLVCVAPTCIIGTGMNRQRNADGIAALQARQRQHPKLRWLEPIEVARMIHFLLCVDEGYTTGVVVRMSGGEHCGSR